jgi:SAM-dependent methyltransferase
MNLYGTIRRTRCPVCGAQQSEEGYWRLPMSRLAEPVKILGAITDAAPCLNAETLYNFDRCAACEAVYLNPVSPMTHSDEYARKHLAESEADRHAHYRGRFETLAKWMPADPQRIVDVAAGAGELLDLAKQRWPNAATVGIDGCRIYVLHMQMHGHTACEADLQSPRCLTWALDGKKADFVVFSEAFEHMIDAGVVMGAIATILRPGGRLFVSAQGLGLPLPIRPSESIYVTDASLTALAKQLGVRVLACTPEVGRFLAVFERP